MDAVAPKLYSAAHLILVAGGADAIGQELTRLGDVTILEPEKESATVKTLPKAASK